MSRKPRKPSSFRMTIRLRLRHSWMRLRQRQTHRRLLRENKRLVLLQLTLDSQLLLLTQLEEREQRLLFNQAEMLEATAYRQEGRLEGPPPAPIFLPPGRPM